MKDAHAKDGRPASKYWFRMSATLISIIKSGEWAKLSAASRSVYPVLWSHARKKDWRAWPETKTIMRLSGLKKTAVYDALRELSDAGLLTIKKKPRRGRRAEYASYIIIEREMMKSSSNSRPDHSAGTDNHSATADDHSVTADYIEHLPLNTDQGTQREDPANNNNQHDHDHLANKTVEGAREMHSEGMFSLGIARLRAGMASLARESNADTSDMAVSHHE